MFRWMDIQRFHRKTIWKDSNIVGLVFSWYFPINHCNRKFNSLAPGKIEWNFRHIIFKQILVIDDWGISCECALIWMSLDFADDQLTLVQVMAWCRQATSHYLSQCWPRSLSPYGVTMPQWLIINISSHRVIPLPPQSMIIYHIIIFPLK